MLNVPDEMFKSRTSDQFWSEVNQPFLDKAISRGDDIGIVKKPSKDVLQRQDGSPTGFGREMQYLSEHGYVYDSSNGKMVKGASND